MTEAGLTATDMNLTKRCSLYYRQDIADMQIFDQTRPLSTFEPSSLESNEPTNSYNIIVGETSKCCFLFPFPFSAFLLLLCFFFPSNFSLLLNSRSLWLDDWRTGIDLTYVAQGDLRQILWAISWEGRRLLHTPFPLPLGWNDANITNTAIETVDVRKR